MVSHIYPRGPIIGEIKTCPLSSLIIDKLPEATESLGIAYFLFDRRDSQNALQLHNKLIWSLLSQLSDRWHGGMTENWWICTNAVEKFSSHQMNNFIMLYATFLIDSCMLISWLMLSMSVPTAKRLWIGWVNSFWIWIIMWQTYASGLLLHMACPSSPGEEGEVCFFIVLWQYLSWCDNLSA